MPVFAGEPWKAFDGALSVFQIKSDKGAGAFYFRITLPARKRVEGLIAKEFRDNPSLEMALRQPAQFTDPCTPPQSVIDAAMSIYHRLKGDANRGKLLNRKGRQTLHDAARGYLASLEQDVKNGLADPAKLKRAKGLIERFIYPYIALDVSVTQITPAMITAWQKWRDRYWLTGPGREIKSLEYKRGSKTIRKAITDHERVIPTISTKNSEWTAIKKVFDWAVIEGWMEDHQVPKNNFRKLEAGEASKTPAFTPEQWQQLSTKADEWVGEAKVRGDNLRFRQLCWFFCRVLRAYGLRVAEGYDLYKSHIVWINDVPFLAIGAIKTRATKKHQRTIEPVAEYTADMVRLFREELPAFYQKEYERDWTDNDPMWMHKDGREVKSFKRGFCGKEGKNNRGGLLTFAGLEKDALGNNFTLTSIRHTTITREIEDTNINTGAVAVWAGTSIQMLDRTYNQALMARARKADMASRPFVEKPNNNYRGVPSAGGWIDPIGTVGAGMDLSED